jgi:hypothetical protein
MKLTGIDEPAGFHPCSPVSHPWAHFRFAATALVPGDCRVFRPTTRTQNEEVMNPTDDKVVPRMKKIADFGCDDTAIRFQLPDRRRRAREIIHSHVTVTQDIQGDCMRGR